MDLITFKIILVVSLFAVSLGVAAYSTWGERKIAGGGPRIAQRTHSDIGGFVGEPVRKGHYKLTLTPPVPANSPDAIQRIYDFFTQHIMKNPGGWWASDLLPAMPLESESRPEK